MLSPVPDGALATAAVPNRITIPVLETGADIERRFSGLVRLYGRDGAERIRRSSIAVVGIGGVGSWTAEALARSGVGRIVLIDMDHIAESNLNRQVHALDDTIGQAKIEAMADRIRHIQPECEVIGIDDFVTEDNWPTILPHRVDAVIDACDAVRAKACMAAWARAPGAKGLPFLSVGAAGGKKLAHHVDVADLSLVTHDPLLAQLRYRLRKLHGAPKSIIRQSVPRIGVACVYSREPVLQPAASACEADAGPVDGSLNCHGYGSLVSVTASFGMVAAGWILNRIATADPSR